MVASKTVVTAGHCVSQYNGTIKDLSKYQIWIGLVDINNHEDVFKSDILKAVVHPDYIVKGVAYYDIAVLTIEDPGSRFKPICLPPNSNYLYTE